MILKKYTKKKEHRSFKYHKLWRLACFSHQTVDATQRVIGVVERIGQLVDPIVGLAVPIETHSYSTTVKRKKTSRKKKTLTNCCILL